MYFLLDTKKNIKFLFHMIPCGYLLNIVGKNQNAYWSWYFIFQNKPTFS